MAEQRPVVISNATRSHEEELRDRLYFAFRRDGADPSSFLDLLAAAIEEEAWDKLGLSFLAFVQEPAPIGLGLSLDTLKKVTGFTHKHEDSNPAVKERMTAMRRFVDEERTPKSPEHGEIGGGHTRPDNVSSGGYGNDATYTVRRLKRDRPDLADRVLDGELSAHAAAIEAGFRRRTFTVPEDPEAIARALRKRLPAAQRRRLIELLSVEAD